MNTTLLVMDSSTLITLHNGGVLFEIFKLPFKFTTSDFIKNETRLNWSLLIKLGIRVIELTGQEVSSIYQLKMQAGKGLSAQDISAFYLAKKYKCVLICDDGVLREYADTNQVLVHGSIWMLDQLINIGLVTSLQAAKILERMRLKGAHFTEILFSRTIKRWKK